MKRTSWIVVGLAAIGSCYVIWRIGFYVPAVHSMSTPSPKPSLKAKAAEPNQPAKAGSTQPTSAKDANEPNDLHRAGAMPGPGQALFGPNDVNAPRPPEGMMGEFGRRGRSR